MYQYKCTKQNLLTEGKINFQFNPEILQTDLQLVWRVMNGINVSTVLPQWLPSLSEQHLKAEANMKYSFWIAACS